MVFKTVIRYDFIEDIPNKENKPDSWYELELEIMTDISRLKSVSREIL